MDFAEGSAFDDFVKMVEDAKYKEAILDSDVPRPDRKFPSPPRGFNYADYCRDHDVGLALVVNEPLGRFFLLQCCATNEAAGERDMLAFADAMSMLRRMDPLGLADVHSLTQLCSKFRIQLLSSSSSPTPASPASSTIAVTAVPHKKTTVSSSFSQQATMRLLQGRPHHTEQCIELNRQVQHTIELGLAAAYDRLVTLPQHKKIFHLYVQLKYYSQQPLTEYSIKYHRALGVGAFGIVFGCTVASLGTVLAMKIMNKRKIKAKKAANQVTAERDALEALALHPSPFCLRLRYSFETPEAYHFILPLAIAGDLQFHLRLGPFAVDRAKVYAAQVALGLGHIHSLGMIIRDLKPRNILLTSAGVCQISDFGLAVQLNDKIKGRAGTEGYWSPEVINGLAYGVDADWWSFGACLFEFLAGVCPFSAKHCGVKKRNDATRRGEIKFTPEFDAEAKPLVLALLDLKPENRVQGVDAVLDASRWAFWGALDLDAVHRNEVKAPWLPERGKIYAASQGEIQENEKGAAAAAGAAANGGEAGGAGGAETATVNLQKIKILPEDAIPFDAFVDEDSHQRDICKVLHGLQKDNKLESALQSVGRTCVVS